MCDNAQISFLEYNEIHHLYFPKGLVYLNFTPLELEYIWVHAILEIDLNYVIS